MPSLSDKLKALGVEVGDQSHHKTRDRHSETIEHIIPGHILQTTQGETYVVEENFPIGWLHGREKLQLSAPRETLALWAGESRIKDLSPQSFAFLDTETTGLSGGTGTYAFMIGVGRFKEDGFHLAQFFMRDPIEEPAQLMALENFLAPCEAIVTFNGKAFDIPLLTTRYTIHSWHSPFAGLAHIDLLHLARRLWRDRLPKRALLDLEAQILNIQRSEEDVPGWLVPKLYSDYILDGDPQPLKSVFYHNAIDILSLVALFNHTAQLLTEPVNRGSEYGVDLISLAKLFEDLGKLDISTRLYLQGLEHDDAKNERLSTQIYLQALQRLAHIHKRQENYQDAIFLWKQATHHHHLDAYVELAKFYEHKERNYPEAINWTQSAIELIENFPNTTGELPFISKLDFDDWLAELRHRLSRLHRKQSTGN